MLFLNLFREFCAKECIAYIFGCSKLFEAKGEGYNLRQS